MMTMSAAVAEADAEHINTSSMLSSPQMKQESLGNAEVSTRHWRQTLVEERLAITT